MHFNFLRLFKRGNDLAKTLIVSPIEACRRMELQRVEILASGTVGGYAWAKYGWLPWDEQEWIILAHNIRARMRAMAEGTEAPTWGG